MNRRRHHRRVHLWFLAGSAIMFAVLIGGALMTPEPRPQPVQEVTQTARKAAPHSESGICPLCRQRAVTLAFAFRCADGHRFETNDHPLLPPE
jgi:hypothetical protein